MSTAGVGSRREADDFIQKGAVKVNDVVVTELGTKITRQDVVTFNEKPVQIESKVYIVLNKPKNCVTTSDDPQERLTVMDLVKNACQERIYPVGRLDRYTTGVLLLTNDGDFYIDSSIFQEDDYLPCVVGYERGFRGYGVYRLRP